MRRSTIGFFAVSALLAASAPLAFSAFSAQSLPPQSRSQVEARSRRASDRIGVLQREAETLARREKTLLGDLRRLEIERDLRAEELRALAPAIAALDADVAATGGQLRSIEQALAAKRPVLAARLVDMYKLGAAGYVRLWFAVDDLRSVGRAFRIVSALAALDRERIADYQASLARLASTRTDLGTRAARLAALRDGARIAETVARQAVAAGAALIRQIDERRDLNAQLVGELEQAHAKLQATLASLPSTAASASAGGAATILPMRPFRGALDWPVDGAILSPFGPSRHPRFGTTTVNAGVEIAASEGTPARAVHEGTVVFADSFTGFGRLVIVDHGGQAYSLYGHLASLAVERGAHLDQGQPVGTVGRGPTGKPSLYFELRIDGQPVDPVQWLRSKTGT